MASKTVAFTGKANVGRYDLRREVEFRFSGPTLDEMRRRGISWVIPRNRESDTVLVTLVATFNPEAENAFTVQIKKGGRYATVRIPMKLVDEKVVEQLSGGTTHRTVLIFAEGDMQIRWELAK